VAEEVSEQRFRGLRIFDISDLTRPKQVGAVQTCRGSHTHTVVDRPDNDGRIIVYNSGTARCATRRRTRWLPRRRSPEDERTALFSIDVIEIPVDRPVDARIIHSPAVFADPGTGILAGLWERGDHGPDTQTTSETNHCHDITVFPASGHRRRRLLRQRHPVRHLRPDQPGAHRRGDRPGICLLAFGHLQQRRHQGAFTDEWGGGSRARCRAYDPLTWGANAIYDIVDGKLEFRSYFKMPAPQTEQENCVAHNGSLVPVPGRDIMVQAWYQGGISVFDFTDSVNPVEIAYFDRGPIDEETWSPAATGRPTGTGPIYGTEIVRGLDVLALLPSDYLSANELAAAALADQGAQFNPSSSSRDLAGRAGGRPAAISVESIPTLSSPFSSRERASMLVEPTSDQHPSITTTFWWHRVGWYSYISTPSSMSFRYK
jgi:hypothetical protein